jgi:hypothetical protein
MVLLGMQAKGPDPFSTIMLTKFRKHQGGAGRRPARHRQMTRADLQGGPDGSWPTLRLGEKFSRVNLS